MLASVELKKRENRDDLDFLQMNGYVPCSHRHLFLVIFFYLDTIYILQADLDKFARSLRIKEYFSAKERDCPVDGSSDSEDDNEIPLPRYKKKKFMESKTQQKYNFRILY
jgi:hypothetical protein